MVKVKVKVSPLQAMNAHGECGCKSPHIAYIAKALGRGRTATPTFGRLYPRESSQ